MSETNESSERTYKVPSILNVLSYGSAGFWSMFAWTVFGSYVFYFYEVEIGLDTLLIFFAMLIFTLWDAINDPLIGFLTDRRFKFVRKLGKRMPWIIIGIIPATFVFALLFMPPAADVATNPWPIFIWIILTTCLFDTLTSLCFVNVEALFPDKFRTDSARRKGRGWGTPLSILALPVASIVPPLLFTFGDPASYANMAWICVAIMATVVIIFLPGMYENKELRERYYIAEPIRPSFIKEFVSTLKQRSFVIYIVLFFGFQIVTGSLTASIPYAVNFVLQGTETDIILLFVFFLNGAIISIPIWIYIAKKIANNKKTAVIGGFSLFIGTLLTFFYVGLIDSLVYMTILGFSMGNYWALMTVYFSDVMDERVVLTGSDIRGTSVGIQAFFSRLSRGAQIAIFAIVHELTGFIVGSPTQPPSAQFGIRLHMSLIPSILLIICVLIFWRLYPLTREKVFMNKQKLKELGFLT